jgi:hypothetical protein
MSDQTVSSPGPAELEFRFAFALPELIAGRFWGISPSTAGVTIEGDRFIARYGPWRVQTSLGNIAGAQLTGPYSWPKIIGPAHLSLKDGGLTFASSDRQGVCVRFKEPVPGLDPLGILKHRGLTVTVDDPPALIEVLEQAARLATEAEQRAERHPDRPTLGGIDEDGSVPAPTLDEVMDEVVDDLHGMSAKELRERARSLGIAGVSSMKKDELVDVLTHHGSAADAAR